MSKKEIIKKFNKLKNIFWVRVFFIVGIPLLMMIVIKPEWIGRFFVYLIFFHLLLIVAVREMFRKDYSKVKIVSGIEKKIAIGVTKFFAAVIVLLFLFYGSSYYKDAAFLLKNKKPAEMSGEVVGYSASLYSGFGYIGQFLDIRATSEEGVYKYTLVFHSIVKKGSNIKFYYLPNSNMIVQVLENR